MSATMNQYLTFAGERKGCDHYKECARLGKRVTRVEQLPPEELAAPPKWMRQFGLPAPTMCRHSQSM